MSTSAWIGGPVGPPEPGFHQLSPVNHDQRHPQGPGLERSEAAMRAGGRWPRSWENGSAPGSRPGWLPATCSGGSEDHLEIGGIYVIGHGQITVASTFYLGPAQSSAEKSLAVAIQGVGMEVYHKTGLPFTVSGG